MPRSRRVAGSPYFVVLVRHGGEGIGLPIQEPWREWKMNDCFWEAFSNVQIFVAQHWKHVNDGRTEASRLGSNVFFFKCKHSDVKEFIVLLILDVIK